MATTVGSHGVAAFTNPSNGDSLDATVVKGNDNTLRSAYVDHDSDGGIHLQSSLLAARPAAGTAGRKWLTTDTGSVKLWVDTGSAWEEVDYVPNSGTATLEAADITGDLTVDTDTLVVDATNNRVGIATASPTVALDVTGAAKVSNGVTVTAGGLTVSAGGASITGTVTATTFSGSGASLTNLPAGQLSGTLPAISGANLTNLNGSNIASGTVSASYLPTSYSSLTFTSGVTISGGSVTFSQTTGTPSALAFATSTSIVTSGSGSVPAFTSNAPTTGTGWTWIRVSLANGSSTGYIPLLGV